MSVKIVPQLDAYPSAVAFAQTPFGKGLVVGVFALLLLILKPQDVGHFTVFLLLLTFFPERRKGILGIAALTYASLGLTDYFWAEAAPFLVDAGVPERFARLENGVLVVFAVLLFCAFFLWLAGSSPWAGMIRRPVLLLVAGYFAFLCAIFYLPFAAAAKAVLWLLAIVLGKYLWFLCYSVKELKSPRPPDFVSQLGVYLPFWYPRHVPIPKGYAYLLEIEAKTPPELAITQLKGLKLAIWALALRIAADLLGCLLFGQADLSLGALGPLELRSSGGAIGLFSEGAQVRHLVTLPFSFTAHRYREAFALSASGSPLPWFMNWISMVGTFTVESLQFIAEYHVVIASCRLCGFNALRNSRKPFAATSVVEFWGRYYFYYKELLVTFFFYPVFFRHFKKHPKTRLFVATFAAAGFGNFLYHYLKDISYVIELGPWRAIGASHVFLFYCLVLSLAIFVSQLRSEGRAHQRPGPARIFLSRAWVFLFYCLLWIFAFPTLGSIRNNFAFLFSLFNIRLA